MIAVLISVAAHADSFTGENAGLTIHQETALLLDSWADGERMVWRGLGTLTVTAPDDTTATLTWGNDLYLDQVGQWELTLGQDQDEGFSVEVYDQDNTLQLGRLHSQRWIVSVADGGWLEQYFFVPVPQEGDVEPWPEEWEGRIVKARLEGLHGDGIIIAANRTGTEEAGLQSVPLSLTEVTAELPLYLNFPESISPTAPATDAGTLEAKWSSERCAIASPGISSVELVLDTEVRGQVALGCTLDDVTDLSAADGDVIVSAGMGPGYAGWLFEGMNTLGDALATPGVYTCGAHVLVSPAHLLIANADLAEPGVRLYETVAVGSYQSQAMFWNDLRFDDGTTWAASGAAGVASGDYDDAGEADVNAHGWGSAPGADSRGSDAWIDTWSALAVTSSEAVTVTVVDPAQDLDQDGLPDAEEACWYGTDSEDEDTDGDGISDGDEVADGTDPLDPDDPSTPDKSDPEADVSGNVAGGACRCAAAPSARGAWALALVVLVGWRRRTR